MEVHRLCTGSTLLSQLDSSVSIRWSCEIRGVQSDTGARSSPTCVGFPLLIIIPSLFYTHPTALTRHHFITTSVFKLGLHLWPDTRRVTQWGSTSYLGSAPKGTQFKRNEKRPNWKRRNKRNSSFNITIRRHRLQWSRDKVSLAQCHCYKSREHCESCLRGFLWYKCFWYSVSCVQQSLMGQFLVSCILELLTQNI